MDTVAPFLAGEIGDAGPTEPRMRVVGRRLRSEPEAGSGRHIQTPARRQDGQHRERAVMRRRLGGAA